jgi:hypothetical protein
MAPNERPFVRGRPVFKAFPETFKVPNGLEALGRRLLLLGADGKDGPGFGGGKLFEGGASSEGRRGLSYHQIQEKRMGFQAYQMGPRLEHSLCPEKVRQEALKAGGFPKRGEILYPRRERDSRVQNGLVLGVRV